jgi:hypothetical protein
VIAACTAATDGWVVTYFTGSGKPAPVNVRRLLGQEVAEFRQVAPDGWHGVTVDIRHTRKLAQFATAGRTVSLYAAGTNVPGYVCTVFVADGWRGGGCSGGGTETHPSPWSLSVDGTSTDWGGRWYALLGSMPTQPGLRVTMTMRDGSTAPAASGTGWFLLVAPADTPRARRPRRVTVTSGSGATVHAFTITPACLHVGAGSGGCDSTS